MELDEAIFTATEIAELAQTEVLNIHTWTTRGFADPHHVKQDVRRGRGQPRTYSLRDGLRFFLMARLHKQYGTPLPQGDRLCQMVFGFDFEPDRAAFLVLKENTSQMIAVQWCQNVTAVGQCLAQEPLATVINVKHILQTVRGKALRLRPPSPELGKQR